MHCASHIGLSVQVPSEPSTSLICHSNLLKRAYTFKINRTRWHVGVRIRTSVLMLVFDSVCCMLISVSWAGGWRMKGAWRGWRAIYECTGHASALLSLKLLSRWRRNTAHTLCTAFLHCSLGQNLHAELRSGLVAYHAETLQKKATDRGKESKVCKNDIRFWATVNFQKHCW